MFIFLYICVIKFNLKKINSKFIIIKMENIPGKINKDQLIKMEVDKQLYYFHYRGYEEAAAKHDI